MPDIVENNNLVSIQDGSIVYYLKCTTNISGTRDVSVTSYPTTEGTAISDHTYRQPARLTISLKTSRYISWDNVFYIDDNGKVIILSVNDFKALIYNWYKHSTRLIINTREQTDMRRLENMVLTSESVSEDSNNRGMWETTLNFSEVRIATLLVKTVKFPASTDYGANETYKTDAGNDYGTKITGGGMLGAIAGGATIGAGIGMIAGGHPVIGAVIGGTVGFFKYLFERG